MEPMHPADRTYSNATIRLPDLAVVSNTLERLTFQNSVILGPAIIVPLGSTSIGNCNFEGDEEGLFWDVGDRQHLIGAIGLADCTIVGCRFTGVGIAVRPEDRDMVRRGFGFRQ
jgi:hypothetical protein